MGFKCSARSVFNCSKVQIIVRPRNILPLLQLREPNPPLPDIKSGIHRLHENITNNPEVQPIFRRNTPNTGIGTLRHSTEVEELRRDRERLPTKGKTDCRELGVARESIETLAGVGISLGAGNLWRI